MKLFLAFFALLATPAARAATLEFKQDAGASTSITWDGNTLEVPQHLKLTALRSLEATLAHDKAALLAAVATQRAELAALEATFGTKVAAAVAAGTVARRAAGAAPAAGGTAGAAAGAAGATVEAAWVALESAGFRLSTQVRCVMCARLLCVVRARLTKRIPS